MSEEIASADSLLQQLADLRAELTQARNATTAERRARRNAEADNAELIRLATAAVECVRGLCYSDGTDAAIKRADRWMPGFMRQMAVHHPGAALLTELTLLRELYDDVQRWRATGGDPRDLSYILETADKLTVRSE